MAPLATQTNVMDAVLQFVLPVRLLVWAIVGSALAIVVIAVVIAWAYYRVNAQDLAGMPVRLLGIHVYDVVRSGAAVTGTAVSRNLPLIAVIFAAVAMLVGEAARALTLRG